MGTRLLVGIEVVRVCLVAGTESVKVYLLAGTEVEMQVVEVEMDMWVV